MRLHPVYTLTRLEVAMQSTAKDSDPLSAIESRIRWLSYMLAANMALLLVISAKLLWR